MRIIEHFFIPAGLLTGTIIGAGVFALPFVFKAAGLSLGFFYLILGAVVYTSIHLLYADVILRTPGEHRFVGYAKYYFGAPGFGAGLILALIQTVFVMTVYLIISVSFSQLLAPAGSAVAKLFVFWAIASLCIFLNLRRLALLEAFIAASIVGIIGFIFFMGLGRHIGFSAYDLAPHFSNAILPLGPVLFSFSGLVAIPSLVRYFRRRKAEARHIRRAISFGTFLPALIYGAFVIGILGLTPSASQDAVSGLVGAVPPFVLMIVGVLGILSILSSYIVVGLDVTDILGFDLHLPTVLRAAVVVVMPLLLYFFGFQNFLELVSFIGGTFLAIEGMFIVMIWRRAVRRYPDHDHLLHFRPLALTGLFVVLFLALVSEAVMFFKL